MKIRKKLTVFALAVMGVISASTSARALVYSDGDVFVAFRVTGATSDSYIVNIGSITQFNISSGSSITFGGLSTTGADLATVYGAGWFDNANLSWSIFTTLSTDNITNYASRARANASTPATPWLNATYDDRANTASAITTVQNGFVGTGYTTSTTGLVTSNAGRQAGTGVNSFYASVNGASDFAPGGALQASANVEGKNASGIDNTVLDFIAQGQADGDPVINSRTLGSFTINDNGLITFTAVPEPTTLGLLAVSGFALLNTRRRRAQAVNA